MPPLFTSFNWTSLVRTVIRTARQAKVQPQSSASTVKASTHSTPWSIKVQRAQVTLRQALHETFPTLQTPAYAYARIPPSQSVTRSFSTTATRHYGAPLTRASQAFRMSNFRLGGSHPRGPAIVSRVGLSANPARTFASSSSSTAIANAPVILRALASLINDDELTSLPKSSKYDSFHGGRNTRRRERRVRRRIHLSCTSSSASSGLGDIDRSMLGSWMWKNSLSRVDVRRRLAVSDLDVFFPLARRSPVTDGPALPEDLITTGFTTTLSLSLRPSDDDLLQPGNDMSYRDMEIGVKTFGDLFHGQTSLMTAFRIHRSTRVLPLFARLESLGVCHIGDHDPLEIRMEEVAWDEFGQAETVLLIFPERSEKDVRALLGEALVLKEEEREDPWFEIYQSRAFTRQETEATSGQWAGSREDQYTSLSSSSVMGADDEMFSAWTPLLPSPSPLPAIIESTVDLIFPTVDVSSTSPAYPSLQTSSFISDFSTPPEPYSWPVSEDVTPLHSPIEVSPRPLNPHSIAASLISHLSDESSNGRNAWSVDLSPEDLDIVSSGSDRDEMEVEDEIWSLHSGDLEGVSEDGAVVGGGVSSTGQSGCAW